jgi:mannose-1-phosphate guanylyltransferase
LHPKPFLRLADGQSLLQKAFLRAAALPGVEQILTVTNRELFFKAEDEFREVNSMSVGTSFICEPFARNTAAAVAAAVTHVANVNGPETMLLVLAADHLIADQAAFSEAVERAMVLAREGKIVTFGIQPESPETGYGYIEAKGTEVIKFVEKPALEIAKQYLESGRFLWNSGIFCFTASAMLRELQEHCPEILDATRECLTASRVAEGDGWTQVQLEPKTFGAIPEDSIDYAVMEKCKQAAVVNCSIGWSDIGSWAAVSELCQPDANGNRVEGEALLHDVGNCYFMSRERIIAAVGVDNLIVIDTPDALLVVNRDRAQDVRHIYAQLKSQGHETHKIHRTAYRPWGSYTVLEEGPRFKIKRIEVKPVGSLSLQMHHHRSEHWIVVSGMAKVVNGERELFVSTNESTYIPAGHKHRLENPGVVGLVMIEVQSGEYLGEDDIVRFEDVYGRA